MGASKKEHHTFWLPIQEALDTPQRWYIPHQKGHEVILLLDGSKPREPPQLHSARPTSQPQTSHKAFP
ncbi:hypothetical protein M758_9G077200 [Ceratodon purpureus]|nr:hypothetical protein M758_9G077200 [Ceratodon purpureus]